MKFAVIVYETPEGFAARSDEKESPAYWGSYMAYSQALREAGVAAGGTALEVPALATSLRVRNGTHHVQDGPFPDTKEQLGGLFVIDVPDMDAALQWAARCPAASYSSVEIRPVLEMGPPR